MTIIQEAQEAREAKEAIWRADTEEDLREFCDKNPQGAIANKQVSLTKEDGVYMIHMASCPTLKGDRHAEGQADTKYEKYCAYSWLTLHERWRKADLCTKCMSDSDLMAIAYVRNLNASVLRHAEEDRK